MNVACQPAALRIRRLWLNANARWGALTMEWREDDMFAKW